LSGTRLNSVKPSPTKSVSTVSVETGVLEQWLINLLDLSLEFLMGRALDNAMLNVGLKDAARGKKYNG
jgi:glucan phosphorylase